MNDLFATNWSVCLQSRRRRSTERCEYIYCDLWHILWEGMRWANNHRVCSEMGPDPTPYIWPPVNKRSTQLWPGYFLIRPEEIFLTRRVKIEKLTFSGEIFQTQTIYGWPNPTWVKNFDPDPSLVCVNTYGWKLSWI